MAAEHGKFLGLQILALNLANALVLGLFFAIGLRALLLYFLDRGHGRWVIVGRTAAGAAYLVLGWLYMFFSAPLIVWDRPARAVVAITAALVPVLAVAWHLKARDSKPPGLLAGVLSSLLCVGMIFAATATLLRAGFLALTGDRVTLTVDVTGETRPQTAESAGPDQPATPRTVTAHRVKFWLPTGIQVGDYWINGDRLAVKGRVLRLPPVLSGVGIPNFYQLLEVHNGYVNRDPKKGDVRQETPFAAEGPLAVHPWWRPIQTRLIHDWQGGDSGESWWALGSETNESPYYPLVEAGGKPLHRQFLFVLPPSGIPTSRGSSPLEGKVEENRQ